ncbi:NAD(P)-binding protein [Accumulibacter sp.]|uniref:potassium channel family protein n=1 Tax=Accumulibacter sp. TaxID=2053492 RepID=UPI0026352F46|nr:NAD(P)-binding protein [Accumulibacter sp.]
MTIYRVNESRSGQRHLQEWRRRALHTLGQLLLATLAIAIGLIVLDSSGLSLEKRFFAGMWNAANLVTTVGDFSAFNEQQKVFMLVAMFMSVIIGGYAISQLTGLLSSDAALAARENRTMKRILDGLANHVVVIGFSPLGRLVAGRMRAAGDQVIIVEKLDDLSAQASELDYLVVQDDAGLDDDVLKRAGADKARALVVMTEDQDRKLAITLMAHALNPRLHIVATGQNSQRGALLERAGASEVVIADDLVAAELVARLGGKAGPDRQ